MLTSTLLLRTSPTKTITKGIASAKCTSKENWVLEIHQLKITQKRTQRCIENESSFYRMGQRSPCFAARSPTKGLEGVSRASNAQARKYGIWANISLRVTQKRFIKEHSVKRTGSRARTPGKGLSNVSRATKAQAQKIWDSGHSSAHQTLKNALKTL